MKKPEIIQYTPADAILLTGDRTKSEKANFNLTAGPAFSLLLDGELIGCGGVRLQIGEAWCLWKKNLLERLKDPDYAREKKIIFKTTKEKMEEIARQQELWKLIAEARISENFLEHLKFTKKEIFVR